MDAQAKMQVAQTIKNQLGGNKLAMMTGAKNFYAIERDGNPGCRFSIPYNAGTKINRVIILLKPNDTYSVEFGRVWGQQVRNHQLSRGGVCNRVDYAV